MTARAILTLIFLINLLPALAQNEHQRAAEMYRNGQYTDALVLLDESIASYPDWYYPLVLKGQCYLELGNFEEALRNFHDALTLELDSEYIPVIKYGIAQAYMSMKEYSKAVQAYSELVVLVPASRKFELYYNRGQAEMQLALVAKQDDRGYYSKAVVSFSEALKQQAPNTELEVETRRQLAYVQDKVGDIRNNSITGGNN